MNLKEYNKILEPLNKFNNKEIIDISSLLNILYKEDSRNNEMNNLQNFLLFSFLNENKNINLENNWIVFKILLMRYLFDKENKLSPLILNQCPELVLSENLPLNIQVGRTYFNILVMMKKSFFSCCNCSVNTNEYSYILQSHKNINYSNSIIIKDNDNNEDICSNDSKDNEIQKMKLDINKNYIEIKEKDNNEILETDRDDKNKRTRNNMKTIPFGTTETQA